MFSALKRLATNTKNDVSNGKTNNGLQAMSSSLQKKFAKGVHYNSLFNY